MGRDIVGWISSAILLVTLAVQTHKLYKTRSNRGVSKWLYIGELGASTGFTIYAVLIHNAVYMVTNSLGIATSLCGLVFFLRNRTRSAPAHELRPFHRDEIAH